MNLPKVDVPHTCVAITYGSAPYYMDGGICGCKARMQHKGKWYCGRHNPDKIATKEAQKAANYKAKRKRINDRHEARKNVIKTAIAVIEYGVDRGRLAAQAKAVKELIKLEKDNA